VRSNKLPGQPEPTEPPSPNERHAQVLARLQDEFAQGLRRIEPLVLRAPAGACMEVTLRNHLPPDLGDGPLASGEHNEAMASDNFMSMILDGFNTNQMRTSTSVGLSAPMLGRLGLVADGANFGLNAQERQRTHVAEQEELTRHLVKRHGRQATPLGATAPTPPDPDRVVAPQANLTPPCRDGEPEHHCTSSPMLWYAGEHRLDPQGVAQSVPIEFGALPLSSYADVFKHAAHGAIGALVIGPEGSRVCESDDPREREADQHTETSATICTPHGRYRDFVLALQDAVDARIRGDRVPNLKGAEEPDDYGIKAVNYRSEPLWGRRGGDPSIEFEERNEFEYGGVLSSKAFANVAPLQSDVERTPEPQRPISPSQLDHLRPPVTPADADQMLASLGFQEASKRVRCQAGVQLLAQDGRHACDPETPLFVAQAGREVRLRVVHPGGHTRQQAFTVHGHDWDPAPWNAGPPGTNRGSHVMRVSHEAAMADAWTVQGSYNGVGPMMAANLLMHAGGRAELPMDYLWRSQASFVFDGGIWGLMRVVDKPKER
jgi:hypothetical protein